MYGKIINGSFVVAPKKIITEDSTIYNPSVSMLESLGYKYVMQTPMPVLDGYFYTPKYTENENNIIQEWEQHEIELDEITQLELAIAELANIVVEGEQNG